MCRNSLKCTVALGSELLHLLKNELCCYGANRANRYLELLQRTTAALLLKKLACNLQA